MYEEKKRIAPYYLLMQKKRSYPVLPWLPYSADRKKRFPIVAKRSAKRSTNEALDKLSNTDEKIANELSELFGSSQNVDEKKKRSIESSSTTTTQTTHTESIPTTEVKSINATDSTKPMDHHEHHSKEHKHHKRSDDNHSHESQESEEESSEHDEEVGIDALFDLNLLVVTSHKFQT